MNFVHKTDCALPNLFDDAMIIFPGVNLCADLSDELLLPGQFSDDPTFGNRARKRLLAINMTPTAQSGGRHNGVRVVGCRNDDRVNVLLVEQPAKIVVGFRSREFSGCGGQKVVVHVAQRHDVFAGDIVHVVAALIGDPDDANVQLFVGGDSSRSRPATRKPQPGGCSRGAAQKLPAGKTPADDTHLAGNSRM